MEVYSILEAQRTKNILNKKISFSILPHLAILIRGASGGLITLKGVLIIHYCFCFTLRTMFKLSLGRSIQEFNFFSKIQLLYLLTCFSFLFSVVWLSIACAFLSFFCLFRVSYELGWCLVMVLRMLWYCAQIVFLS